MQTQWKCRICGLVMDGRSPSVLTPHHRTAHPVEYAASRAKNKAAKQQPTATTFSDYPSLGTVLDRIHWHEGRIGKLILELDSDRNRLQDKLRELDNTAAKYRKAL